MKGCVGVVVYMGRRYVGVEGVGVYAVPLCVFTLNRWEI